MPDTLTPYQRSYCMSRIKGKDTSLERAVRSKLHKEGFRFRKHVQSLPGKPDIVFPTAKVAVFIDGDFWHGWRFPRWRDNLPPFWADKIQQNRKRDRKNFRQLRRSGWRVLRVWQHQIVRDLEAVVDLISRTVRAQDMQPFRSKR